jgi:hypothetical protein
MNTTYIPYTPPPLCGPCGDVRCSQYGCVKKMFSDKSPNLAQLNITQPYNTNHVAALEMIVKLAGENAVLQKENKQLREAFQKYFGQSEATNTHTPLGEKK